MPDLKKLAARLTELNRQVETLTAERDDARANARILAHAYTHDTRPPALVLETSVAYPADPCRSKRERKGRVIAWNPLTWWGTIGLGKRKVEFHGTSVRGLTLETRHPRIGDAVTVIFSDEKCERLLSVEHRSDA